MTYTLRLWVNGKLEETLEVLEPDTALKRFRDIVSAWPADWSHHHWFVSVNAEPGPYPERSYAIASYQHCAGLR